MASTRTSENLAARGTHYAERIVAGKIPSCYLTRRACERHLADLDKYRAKDAKYFFDEAKAHSVCNIVQHFPHIKGDWARRGERISLNDWQCFIVSNVFGWKRRDTNTRRFRTVYVEVPRKNAKSTLTSAIGLYLTACDDEPGAYVVSAANSQKQAQLVFNDAQAMARREKGFLSRFGVEVLAHSIVQVDSASRFEALSAEYSNLDGLNVHAALVDELHAHNQRGLWDVLETATGSRSQPLIWAITTAGVNRAGVCYDQRAHVIDVLNGVVADDSYFGMIYTVDDGDDPWVEDTWIKANPNYGVSIYADYLQSQAARAQTMPSMQNNFLTKHLDIWVSADTAWLPAGAWDKCADPKLDLEDFRGKTCYVGVDLALRSDLAALMVAFPPEDGRDYWAVFGKYYLPSDVVQRSENAHFQGWEVEGYLTATSGPITDFDYILEDLANICTAHYVADICVDPYHAGPLINYIEKRGMPKPVAIRQDHAHLSPAMVEFEGLVLAKRIRHDGDPVLSWMQSNVRCKRTAGDLIYPTKDNDDRKIDGITALLMVIGRAMSHNQYASADYENRGLWII